MHLLFINLEQQTERRRFVENNFAANNASGWTIERLPASGPAAVASEAFQGTLKTAEKACYFSHMRAIERSMAFAGHCMIAEDDVLFGEQSQALVKGAIAGFPEDDWDLMFTDVAITSPTSMVELLQFRRALEARGTIQLINLQKLYFAGATAYIVNARSKRKVLSALAAQNPLEFPLDLMFRSLIHSKQLKGQVIFPFATSLSDYAENSQIQNTDIPEAELTWNAFRRLMWVSRDTKQAIEKLKNIHEEYFDEETTAFAMILRTYLSRNFPIS